MREQGYEQLRDGYFEDAIETFSALHAVEANDDAALRGRGLAFMRLGKADFAEADFRLASRINAGEPENRSGLAISLAMQNRIYEAIAVYEDLLIERPDYVPAYLQLARLHLKIGAIIKGRDVLQEGLRRRPNLDQRRLMEALLKEQRILDKNRYYRPDWQKLNGGRASGLSAIIRVLNKGKTHRELGKRLFLWLGSFLIIGACMAYYMNMPLVPIVIAGLMTLIITLLRHWTSNRKS